MALVLFVTDGDRSDNEYGLDPKFDALVTTLNASSSHQEDILDSDMAVKRRYRISNPEKKTNGGG